jgi:hypothetical protein
MNMNALLIILAWIAIFHLETFGHASGSLMIYNDSHQTSSNDVITDHVSAMTATTATMTHVSATRSATTKVPQF